MPQPPAYNRTKDFTENFGTETDHASVNAELDKVSNSINDVRANLAILQADDGKLRPEVVTPESVAPALFSLIVDEVKSDAVQLLAQANAASANAIARASEAEEAADVADSHRITAAASAASAAASAAAAPATVADYAELRAYNGAASTVTVTGHRGAAAPAGTAGTFVRDDGDTISADNGGIVIVAGNGRRYKRSFSGAVSVRWFGAVGDGATDDRAAIQAALDTGLPAYFPKPQVSYLLSDHVVPKPNQELFGDGPTSHIQIVDGTKSAIYGDGVDGVTVRDLKISTKNQTGATAYKAAVLAYNCRSWSVRNVLGFNLGHWGVALWDSSNCSVSGCRFSSWFGTVQDSADIAIYGNSNFNLVDGNFCYAEEAEHGVMIQDPYTGSKPTGNKVINNHVSKHKATGIIEYVTTAYDTQTLISGNHVRDIQGVSLSGQSGHGIYVQSAGGTVVTDNTVTNCCVLTSSFETQAVAAIGVATGNSAAYPTGTISEVIVANNRITAQRGPAIAVQTSGVPVTVSGNSIDSTGTEAVRGEAIYCANADGVQIKNNTIKHVNPNYNAINIVASDAVLDGIAIVGNIIRGAVYGIAFNRTGGGSYGNVVFANNVVKGVTGAAANLSAISGLVMTGNNLSSSGIAFILENCPSARLSGNRIHSPYDSYSIIFTGSAGGNDGAVVDESNKLSGVVLHDAGTGGVIAQYGSSAPAGSGFWAVGDHVINSVPAVGSPKGWRCTAPGNLGTWTSEGNL